MAYRWKPNAAQRKAYHEKMVAIEEAKSITVNDGYTIFCTGDCCKGDEIAFFNAAKSSERLYGKIIKESYGAEKQQHTFTIEVDGETMKIKGRNLYKNNVTRKSWANEEERKRVIEEKHERGAAARTAAEKRKQYLNN